MPRSEDRQKTMQQLSADPRDPRLLVRALSVWSSPFVALSDCALLMIILNI